MVIAHEVNKNDIIVSPSNLRDLGPQLPLKHELA